MAGIYIHIPFCRKACHYCNFHFSTTQHQLPAMVAAIGREAELNRHYLQEPVETIYFGGGTPSLLGDAHLQELMDRVRSNFDVANGAEITLEANPDDIDLTRLTAWKAAGVNRLSIGVQSFFEEDLRWMNRAHDAQQAIGSIRLARESGFDNLTIDLIYGTPHLSDERWLQNIDTALSLGVPHLSCYALTVEPRTALAQMIRKHESADIDTDVQARHFQLLLRELAANGFEQYEISNFAKPGFRSRHNSSYWQGKPYLGLGPSAHSFDGNSRQWNVANNALYISSIEKNELPFERETLTEIQQLNEYLMIALRTMEGIPLTAFAGRFGGNRLATLMEAAQKHMGRGHVALHNDHLVLTPEGKFLADGIAADLFFEED